MNLHVKKIVFLDNITVCVVLYYIQTTKEPVPPLGRYQNQWQMPVSEFGDDDPDWVVRIKASDCVGRFDRVGNHSDR